MNRSDRLRQDYLDLIIDIPLDHLSRLTKLYYQAYKNRQQCTAMRTRLSRIRLRMIISKTDTAPRITGPELLIPPIPELAAEPAYDLDSELELDCHSDFYSEARRCPVTPIARTLWLYDMLEQETAEPDKVERRFWFFKWLLYKLTNMFSVKCSRSSTLYD
jgi:hypothetical protein